MIFVAPSRIRPPRVTTHQSAFLPRFQFVDGITPGSHLRSTLQAFTSLEAGAYDITSENHVSSRQSGRTKDEPRIPSRKWTGNQVRHLHNGTSSPCAIQHP
ncbi:hypothetical protein MKZ38_007675 [Zalerion maritima]|uniref:Uncharacterized protein n=1 Tax=Zalerion maritima TaxID=339359 RepID=A0AAD5RZ05_9PEZI|nr:hypothetical protein MKZ38_007675 [Zalerion maritima]